MFKIIQSKLKVILYGLCLFLVLFAYQNYHMYVSFPWKKMYALVAREKDVPYSECQCQCQIAKPTQCLAPSAIFMQDTEMTDTNKSFSLPAVPVSDSHSAKATSQLSQEDRSKGMSLISQQKESTSVLDTANTAQATIQDFLLTLVVSVPKNKDRRDAIRRTWKNSYIQPDKQFLVKFVIGTLGLSDEEKQSLLAELEQHNDMLLLTDHLDNYNNLTRKVLHMFVWADQSVDYSYLLKTDDNVFVRLDAIESELRAKTDKKPLYWGNILKGIEPERQGKWKDDKWDVCKTYFPYAQGRGYVLSAELIHRVAINADGCILYTDEGVAVSAWTSPFELDRVNDARFDMTGKNAINAKCQNYLLVAGQDTVSMTKRHNMLTSSGFCII